MYRFVDEECRTTSAGVTTKASCLHRTDGLACLLRALGWAGGRGCAPSFSFGRFRDLIFHFDLDSVRESHTSDAAAALALSEKNLLCGFA
jgi:hypothetical protein